MRNLLIATIIVTYGTAAAASESFSCFENRYSTGEPLVIATSDASSSSGTVLVAGARHDAHYSVEGFNRRWDFERRKDGSYRYAFVIQPNGDSAYVDFKDGETSKKPSMMMWCKRSDKIHSLGSSGSR